MELRCGECMCDLAQECVPQILGCMCAQTREQGEGYRSGLECGECAVLPLG